MLRDNLFFTAAMIDSSLTSCMKLLLVPTGGTVLVIPPNKLFQISVVQRMKANHNCTDCTVSLEFICLVVDNNQSEYACHLHSKSIPYAFTIALKADINNFGNESYNPGDVS